MAATVVETRRSVEEVMRREAATVVTEEEVAVSATKVNGERAEMVDVVSARAAAVRAARAAAAREQPNSATPLCVLRGRSH